MGWQLKAAEAKQLFASYKNKQNQDSKAKSSAFPDHMWLPGCFWCGYSQVIYA